MDTEQIVYAEDPAGSLVAKYLVQVSAINGEEGHLPAF